MINVFNKFTVLVKYLCNFNIIAKGKINVATKQIRNIPIEIYGYIALV